MTQMAQMGRRLDLLSFSFLHLRNLRNLRMDFFSF